MIRTALPLLVAATVTTLACSSSAGRPGFNRPVHASVAAAPVRDQAKSNDFNFAMYGQLRSAEKSNFFYSGASMREAIGIAYLGAKNGTASEMAAAIKLDSSSSKSADFAKSEIADFNAAKGGASLSIANRLWPDASYQPKNAFTTLAQQAYGAPVNPLDFKAATDPSRKTINDWVSKQTNDKIKDLLPVGSVTDKTKMVITNAVWFKGNWATAFPTSLTADGDFFVDGIKAMKTPMMHQHASFSVAAIDGATMLEMPYEKSDLVMDILLPDSKTGLGAIEDKVVAKGIDPWIGQLRSSAVDVTFPKLTMTWGKSIKEPLTKLGMKTAFEEGKADFSGIADAATTGGSLYISDVFHKAFVAIDEKGTEAAAATGIVMAPSAAVMASASFVADHPFILVIRDAKQNRVLFTGRVSSPKI